MPPAPWLVPAQPRLCLPTHDTCCEERGVSFLQEPRVCADLMGAVPQGRHLKPTATVTVLEHHILGLPTEGKAK